MTVQRIDHVGIVVDDLAYEDVHRLCYIRGPAGIIVELAEQVSTPGVGLQSDT